MNPIVDSERDLEAKQGHNVMTPPLQTQPTLSRGDQSNSDDVERPPVSPITPSASYPEVNQSSESQQNIPYAPPPDGNIFMKRPESIPINEDENFDVIALKSSVASLELQKEKARRDILKLKRIRDAAVDSPEKFKEDLQSGKITYESRPTDALKAALEGGDDDSDEEDATDAADNAAKVKPEQIPTAQNVVRCPPINWEKYHIIGEPLDRMHEEQRKRPMPGQPWSQEREAAVAAPYDPFKDKVQPQQQSKTSQLPPPMETRRSNHRKKSGP